jgi:hypothetical protein
MSDAPIFDPDEVGDVAEDTFVKDVKEAIGLPEAPASATIRVYIDDFSTLITMRGTETKDIVRQVEFIIDFAKKKGWKSTWNKETPAYAPRTAAQPRATARPSSRVQADPDAPFCPVHNRPMKLFNGKFGNFYKCTAKINETEWCNEKVNIKKPAEYQ